MRTFLFCTLILILFSCASNDKKEREDYLKNTKKLVKKGHADLYKNGALEVPYTEVKLIAPGPKTLEITKNLFGIRAKESLLLALGNLQKTHGLIKAGALKSYLIGKNIYKKGEKIADVIDEEVSKDAYLLIDKSLPIPKQFLVESIEYSKELTLLMNEFSMKLNKTIELFGEEAAANFIKGSNNLSLSIESSLSKSADELSKLSKVESTNTTYGDFKEVALDADRSSKKISQFIYEETKKLSTKHFKYGIDQFLHGYLAFPKKVKDRLSNYSLKSFESAFEKESGRRENYSNNMVIQIEGTLSDYGEEFNKSIKYAKEEVTGGVSSYGVTLGVVKSLAWLTKAVFWDATIRPLGELSAYSLGYLATNAIVYPTMIISKSGVAMTQVAVQVGFDVTKSIYNFTAPTVIVGVASVFSALELSGGLVGSSLMYTTGKVFNYSLQTTGAVGHGAVAIKEGVQKVALKTAAVGVKVSSKVATSGLEVGKYTVPAVLEVSAKVSGEIAEKSIQYIGVPLASVGIPLTTTSVGVGLGAVGTLSGSAYKLSGEILSKSTHAFGTVLAGSTITAGTSLSALGALGLAGYESLKGVAVPSSYMLGSGIVLTYGNLTQLMGQTILAASDLIYLVLSLEGPRWVLYGVRDNLQLGSQLHGGSVLNLNEMKEKGEEFKNIPISEQEVLKLLDSFSDK